MKIPNVEAAAVDQEKIRDYLLNAGHPDNGGKARFFLACGFRVESWFVLAGALRQLAGPAEVLKSVESPHGKKYIVEGRIETPAGKAPTVRTIWIVDRGSDRPRLVTAYPAEEREQI